MSVGPAPADPDGEALERLLERVPVPHRAAVRRAVEQWNLAMWLAASQTSPGEGELAGVPELATAPVLRLYTSFLETLAGCAAGALGGTEPRAPPAELAGAIGELAGTLARLASEAIAPTSASDGTGRGDETTVRRAYDDYVERWERSYREWMLSDDFARLQGMLCNGTLARRAAGRGDPETPP